jgi:hypothetical protein
MNLKLNLQFSWYLPGENKYFDQPHLAVLKSYVLINPSLLIDEALVTPRVKETRRREIPGLEEWKKATWWLDCDIV